MMLWTPILVVACLGFSVSSEKADSTKEIDGAIDTVMLYSDGLAEVVRIEKLQLEPGIHTLVFKPLPIHEGDDFRASVSDGWTVLSIDSQLVRMNMDGTASTEKLIKRVQNFKETGRKLALEHEGMEEDLAFIRQVGLKATANASQDGGTSALDLDSVKSQLEFVQSQRMEIFRELLEMEKLIRSNDRDLASASAELNATNGMVENGYQVKVAVEVKEAGAGEVRLAYLTYDSRWEPVYSVRLLKGNPKAEVQYDALLSQGTGEDWTNVQLTLSTALPNSPSGPSNIQPVFVNIKPEVPEEMTDKAKPESSGFVGSPADYATVRSGGTTVNYGLPRRVTVKSDSNATQRLRIAAFEAPVSLVHVARPIVEERVFLRSDINNVSPYVLLAGKVSLFMEGDFLGLSSIDEVGSGGKFELWWGVDPSITVDRIMLEQDTSRTGLLGGGRRTTLDYRIDLQNTAESPLMLEVWDRQPVSRSGEIEVRLADVEPALATDPAYLQTGKVQGLLKWIITLGPAGAVNAKSSIEWSVRVSRSADIEITSIPE
jgi:uncharacterized protein (TIGR02231 family)